MVRMTNSLTWILLALAYVVGATPTSYWVGRAAHGLDLREHGSGNLGATNALRVMGWKSAIPVLLVDIGKDRGISPEKAFLEVIREGIEREKHVIYDIGE